MKVKSAINRGENYITLTKDNPVIGLNQKNKKIRTPTENDGYYCIKRSYKPTF